MLIKQQALTNAVLLICDSNTTNSIEDTISEDVFDPDYLYTNKLVEREVHGRGTVYFIRWQQQLLALRNYYRGGAIAKLSNNKFVYTGLKQTRCYQELSILEFLRKHKVNVPKPIAAMVYKGFLNYRASIITEVIDNAEELDTLLASQETQHALSPDIWRAIGHEIRKMHDLQVCHYDLNVKNILLQGSKVYLIDFDKCFVKKGDAWKQANLNRLKRSLNKQLALQTGYQFTSSDFSLLLEGYVEPA